LPELRNALSDRELIRVGLSVAAAPAQTVLRRLPLPK
jgi:hypothetical protein